MRDDRQHEVGLAGLTGAGPWPTGEVAAALGLAEARVQTVLRTTPGLRPALIGGRRLWSAADVAALRARLAVLDARREARS